MILHHIFILRFYEDYKRSGLDFHTFYAGYRPTFRPHENCIGLAIEVLERLHTHLTPRWPHLARYTYLASCWMNISAEWINQVEGKITEEIDTRGLARSGLQHVLGKSNEGSFYCFNWTIIILCESS
jgi:hypothetical protein